mgnify:FL=1
MPETKWNKWRRYRADRRMHWINKYKLARGCDVCGYGRIQHGRQAVLAKGLDWAHIDPLSKSSVLVKYKEVMYFLVNRNARDPVKNRKYRRELFDEIRKCRLLCKLDHIAETDERNESSAGKALSAVRKNEPVVIGVDIKQEDMFYDREEQAMG